MASDLVMAAPALYLGGHQKRSPLPLASLASPSVPAALRAPPHFFEAGTHGVQILEPIDASNEIAKCFA